MEAGVSGLVGTIKLGLLNNQGATTQALASTGIIETPAGSGVYAATRVAPTSAGQYTLLWSLDGTTDPEQVLIDELVVTSSGATAVSPSGHDYTTLAVVKALVNVQEDDTRLDSVLASVITAASQAVDDYTHRRFWKNASPEARRYTPSRGGTKVIIHDLVNDLSNVPVVETDEDGDGTFERLWTVEDEYKLTPFNAPVDGKPYTRIVLGYPLRATRGFPYWIPGSCRVTGIFGWPSIPTPVVEATNLLTARLAKREKEAPFGVVVSALDQGTVARVMREDPDICGLLANYLREDIL